MNTINYLKLANYRSLDVLELYDIQPFSVFAGPNGSGKSNFFDALEFVSLVNRFDVEEAFKQHGDFENIQYINRQGTEATVFEFEIQVTSLDMEYQLKLASNRVLRDFPSFVRDDHRKPKAKEFLKNIRLYRIEPKSSLENYRTIQDPSKLHRDGRNLPAVLSRLEKDDDLRETIIDWLELVVPGLETVQTQTERLTGTTALAFKEAGQEKWFPKIEIKGLWSKYNIGWTLHPEVNILAGANGTGKSTVLRLIAGVLTGGPFA